MVSSPCMASSMYSRMSLRDMPVFFRHSMMRSHSKSFSVKTRMPPDERPTKGSSPSLS